jgi:hypothetical protein
MTAEELRAIMTYLREKVRLAPEEAQTPGVITFDGATEEEMIAAGLHAKGVRQILRAPWWEEMVADIIETPDFCDPGDLPQQVLEYARDVVSDYIRKRVPLNDQ